MNSPTQTPQLQELILKNMAVVALGQTILQQIHTTSNEQAAMLQAQLAAATDQLQNLVNQVDHRLQQTAAQTLSHVLENKSSDIFKGLQNNYDKVQQSSEELAKTQKKLIFSSISAVYLSALLTLIAGATFLVASWYQKQLWDKAAKKAQISVQVKQLLEKNTIKVCDDGRICAV